VQGRTVPGSVFPVRAPAAATALDHCCCWQAGDDDSVGPFLSLGPNARNLRNTSPPQAIPATFHDHVPPHDLGDLTANIPVFLHDHADRHDHGDFPTHRAHPAADLAAADARRRAIETVHKEFKTYLRGPGPKPRARTPDLAPQEPRAYHIIYQALRAIAAYAAAGTRGLDRGLTVPAITYSLPA